MAVLVTCPHCGNALHVKEEFVGKRGKCPKCLTKFEVPRGTSPDAQRAGRATVAAPEPARAGTATAVAAAPATAAQVAMPLAREQARQRVLAALAVDFAPPSVSVLRKIGATIVLAILVLLPLVYWGAIAAGCYAVYWLLTSEQAATFPAAAWYTALVAVIVGLLCLLKPIVAPRRKAVDQTDVDRKKHALLVEFVEGLCALMGTPPPKEIRLEPSTRLAAEYRGGLLGIIRRDAVLTVGLPAIACLSVQQLAGLLAEELALFRRGAGSGLTYAILSINGWMWRSIYEADRFDEWLDRVTSRPRFTFGKLLAPLKTVKLVSQIVLWIPMFLGNTLASALLQKTLLDADRTAARLVGHRTLAPALVQLEMMGFAWQGILLELDFRFKDQRLPDSLPHELAARMLDMTPELCGVLKETIIKEVEKPFDYRPPESDRLAAMRQESGEGVLHCDLPAGVLFEDFEALARRETWDYYVSAYGPQRLKAALVPVETPALTP